MENEHKRLTEVAKNFSIRNGFDGQLNQYVYRRIAQWFNGLSVLELGCADGGMSIHLPKHFKRITLVDAVPEYIENVKNLLGSKAEYITGLFEEVSIQKTFDTVLATNILEHVVDPVNLLQKIAEWLSNDGVIICSVPNARSIHRQVGVKMDVLKNIQELSEADHRLGHRRVYTAETLRADFELAGFKVIDIKGVLFKPLSNQQIESQWSVELIDAFFSLADEYPDLSTPLVVLAKRA